LLLSLFAWLDVSCSRISRKSAGNGWAPISDGTVSTAVSWLQWLEVQDIHNCMGGFQLFTLLNPHHSFVYTLYVSIQNLATMRMDLQSDESAWIILIICYQSLWR
jgi:hypothetical protein